MMRGGRIIVGAAIAAAAFAAGLLTGLTVSSPASDLEMPPTAPARAGSEPAAAASMETESDAPTFEDVPAVAAVAPAARAAPPPETGRRRAGASPSPEEMAVVAQLLRKRLGEDVPEARIEQAARLARSRRESAAAMARGADQVAAVEVAKEILREKEITEDAARGGTLEMLRALDKARFDLIDDRHAFEERFRPKTEGATVNGTLVKASDGLPDGTTVRFPVGVYTWPLADLGRDRPIPRDLVVEGAGVDATVLSVGAITSEFAVDLLTFRDLTIDCGGRPLVDLPRQLLVLRLERCRVVGFERTNALFVFHRGAVSVVDSRIEAGWAGPPGKTGLFRTSAALVRFERCVFSGPFESVSHERRETTYVFADCAFERMQRGFAAVLDARRDGVRFDDCTATELDGSEASIDQTGCFPAIYAEPAPGVVVPFVPGRASPQDAAVVELRLPAGACTLDASQLCASVDLVVVGKGIDATLVRIEGHPRARRVFWRDLTFDGRGRRSPVPLSKAWVSFERCRFAAFDGESPAIEFRSDGAVWLRDCRFEGGFGKSPGRGTALRCADAAVRADRCAFALLGGRLAKSTSEKIVLVDSTVTGLDAMDAARLTAPESGVRLVRTRVEPWAGERPTSRRRLSEINPAWPER